MPEYNLSQYLGNREQVVADADRLIEVAKRCWFKDKTLKSVENALIRVSVCDDTIFVQTKCNHEIIRELEWHR